MPASTRPTTSGHGSAPPSCAPTCGARSVRTGGAANARASSCATCSPRARGRRARRSPRGSGSSRSTRSRSWPISRRSRPVPAVPFDHFPNYDELTALLHGWRDEQPDGLRMRDVDGDRRILQMRVRDDNGAWKRHADEPRLMIPRDPDEVGGEYYRLFPEGDIQNYDGVTVKIAPPLEGLDLNRNFPYGWESESVQRDRKS